MNSINNNLMAANVAGNLNSHYNRLATSVQRLSSGLRINSAADDAAGLAIRELMRSDVAALNQGVRNANDAISMLQVADGALGVIDEKLIRMKELAEQAATGTYDSTQRLIIDSEFQAMGAEINRIARATNFNGIHLLDGSLSGRHDGAGVNSTGAMKIHFGAGNDSAEDYYYVRIGACTTEGLGLGSTVEGGGPRKVVVTEQKTVSFTPSTLYDLYTAPNGNTYYKVGDLYCWDYKNPVGCMVTDPNVLASLERKPARESTRISYYVYDDPVTGAEYYRSMSTGYTSNPYDPIGSALDSANASDRAILDRLQISTSGKTLEVSIAWDVWEDPQKKRYYTYNKGNTFTPNANAPLSGVLDKNDPADAQTIDSFTQVYGTQEAYLPSVGVRYDFWRDAGTGKTYYSADGGQTFVSDYRTPDQTRLDPVADAAVIARMEMYLETTFSGEPYNSWRDPASHTTYYTRDNVIWYIDASDHSKASLNINDPADQLIIATLQPVVDTNTAVTTCATYEDRANGNRLYYSRDNGKTYFSDTADPSGSEFSASDPAYASLIANFHKISSTITIRETFKTYYDQVSMTKYYSPDNGKTFFLNFRDPSSRLDPASGNNAQIIGRMRLYPKVYSVNTSFYIYKDPVSGKNYYSTDRRDFFYDGTGDNKRRLDPANPDDNAILGRLNGVQRSIIAGTSIPQHEEVTAYTDGKRFYYSHDGGQTFSANAQNTFDNHLDPGNPADKAILDALRPAVVSVSRVEIVSGGESSGAGVSVSTQQAAQQALVAIDRAIVAKDKIRASLGALQNRLENTVANLTIMAENMQSAESRISDADIGIEMMIFVRNQILTQSSIAMLGQANSYPHMLSGLITG